MKKRVLIISYYWPPAGGPGVQRWLKFVKYLPEFNVEPILFVPENANYPMHDNSLSSEVSKDLKVIRYPIFEFSSFFLKNKKLNSIRSGNVAKPNQQSTLQKLFFFIRGNLFIPDMKIFWKSKSVNFLQNYLSNNKIDVVITTGPPHSLHLIGLELKRRLGIKWISDFRDPWVNLNYLNRFHLLPFVKNYHKRLRDLVIKNSDAVIVTSKRLKDLFSDMNSNVCQITNGYDFVIPDVKLDTKFSISHIGSLYPERNPKVLWDVLDELSRNIEGFNKNLKINLIGNVSEKIKNKLNKRIFNECIVYHDYLSYHEALKFMCSSQVLMMIEVDDDYSSYVIPGKLFDYLNSNRPIISIGPEKWEVKDILSNTSSGISFNYRDYDSLNRHLKKIYKDYLTNLNKSKRNNNIEVYHRKNLTSKLAKLINNIS